MKNQVRYIVIGVGILLTLLGLIYGAYKPFQKSRIFIESLKASKSAKSVEELVVVFDRALTYPSPVGNEEAVKFFANEISGLLNNQSEEVSRAIVKYFDPYLLRYHDDLRIVLQRAYVYGQMWRRYSKESDYLESEKSFLKALELGPRVPRVLYSLFELYVQRGDLGRLREVGAEILLYWPDDMQVKGLVEKAVGALEGQTDDSKNK